jgi:hypothetical protein
MEREQPPRKLFRIHYKADSVDTFTGQVIRGRDESFEIEAENEAEARSIFKSYKEMVNKEEDYKILDDEVKVEVL